MPSSTIYISIFDEQFNDLENAEIVIYQNQERKIQQFSSTNPNIFILDAKPKEYSFDPFYPEPYLSYDIEVRKEGYFLESRKDIKVFEDINSTLDIVMVKNNA